ncbi:hypothetical protein ElyMa_004503200 [Elysia marginata]|uniref:Uncharacterized protein n=1 Tax=Elysia marginata TaxID=1093978 RepID=A0AAV4HPK1_9GAST|nr:hypothetical protein ElyMa_004503200 [Elysia marginata]
MKSFKRENKTKRMTRSPLAKAKLNEKGRKNEGGGRRYRRSEVSASVTLGFERCLRTVDPRYVSTNQEEPDQPRLSESLQVQCTGKRGFLGSSASPSPSPSASACLTGLCLYWRGQVAGLARTMAAYPCQIPQ